MTEGVATAFVLDAVGDFFLVVFFMFSDFCSGDLVWMVCLLESQELEWWTDGVEATLEFF